MSSTPLFILGFDTSAPHCAIVLQSDDKIIAHETTPMAKGQVENLFPLCQDLLTRAKTTWQDLDAIGVCIGPGNFTGVRIGVSAARGLSVSLKKPAIGVSQMDAMAFGSQGDKTVLLDARRDRAYQQSFHDGKPTSYPILVSVSEIDPQNVSLIINPQDVLAQQFQEHETPPHAIALAIAKITASRLGQTNPRPAPLYLQEPNAALPSDPPPKILP